MIFGAIIGIVAGFAAAGTTGAILGAFSAFFQIAQSNRARRALERQREAARDAAAVRSVRPSGSNQALSFLYGYFATQGVNVVTDLTNHVTFVSDPNSRFTLGNLPNYIAGHRNAILVTQKALAVGQLDRVQSVYINDLPIDDDDIEDWTRIYIYHDGNHASIPAYQARIGVVDGSGIYRGASLTQGGDPIKIRDTATFNGIPYVTEFYRVNRDDPQFGGTPQSFYFLRGQKCIALSGNRVGQQARYRNYAMTARNLTTNDWQLLESGFYTGDGARQDSDIITTQIPFSDLDRHVLVFNDNSTVGLAIRNHLSVTGDYDVGTYNLFLEIRQRNPVGTFTHFVLPVYNASVTGGHIYLTVGHLIGFDNGISDTFTMVFTESFFVQVQTYGQGTSQTFTNNAGVVLLDYIRQRFGGNTSLDDIHIESFLRAQQLSARIVDQRPDAGLAFGRTSNRDLLLHEFNGSLSTQRDKETNFQIVLDCMAGALLFEDAAGRLKISLPDLSRTNNQAIIDTVTQTDVIGWIDIQFPSMEHRLNRINIEYLNSSENFASDNYAFRNDTYFLEDQNIILESSQNIHGCNTPYHAHYLANTIVNDSRNREYTFRLNHTKAQLEQGDVIRLRHDLQSINRIVRIETKRIDENYNIVVSASDYDVGDWQWVSLSAVTRPTPFTYDYTVTPPSRFASTISHTDSRFLYNLTWADATDENVTQYEIERQIGSGAFEQIGVINQGIQTFQYHTDVTGVINFRIRAKTLDSRCSIYVNLTPVDRIPVAQVPQGFSAASMVGMNQFFIRLSWSALTNVSFHNFIVVEARIGSGQWNEIGRTPASAIQFDLHYPDAGSYEFRAKSILLDGRESAYSALTPSVSVLDPQPPTNLTVTLAVQTNSFGWRVAWTGVNSNRVATYHIEVQKGAGGAWVEVGSVSADMTEFFSFDTEVTTYLFRVRSRALDTRTSTYLMAMAASSYPVPMPPSDCSASPIDRSYTLNAIVVSWAPNTNQDSAYISGYALEQKRTDETTWTPIAIFESTDRRTVFIPDESGFYEFRVATVFVGGQHSTFTVSPAIDIQFSQVSDGNVFSVNENIVSTKDFRLASRDQRYDGTGTLTGGTYASATRHVTGTVGTDLELDFDITFDSTDVGRHFYLDITGAPAHYNLDDGSIEFFILQNASLQTFPFYKGDTGDLLWADSSMANAGNCRNFNARPIKPRTSSHFMWVSRSATRHEIRLKETFTVIEDRTVSFRLRFLAGGGVAPSWTDLNLRCYASAVRQYYTTTTTPAGQNLALNTGLSSVQNVLVTPMANVSTWISNVSATSITIHSSSNATCQVQVVGYL